MKISYIEERDVFDYTLFMRGSLKMLLGRNGWVGFGCVGDRNDNGKRFVDFRSFHRLIIGRKLFERRTS